MKPHLNKLGVCVITLYAHFHIIVLRKVGGVLVKLLVFDVSVETFDQCSSEFS